MNTNKHGLKSKMFIGVHLRLSAAILLALTAVSVAVSANAATVAANDPNALIEAVQADDRASVTRILATHPDVNRVEDDGSTALAWAAIRCNSEIAQLLMKAGANPNVLNEQGV